MPAQFFFISPPKDPTLHIHEIFPEATSISEKQGEPLIRTIYKEKDIIGYAFETNYLAKMPPTRVSQPRCYSADVDDIS
jgi:NosR/NirI family nitrous oxide reductase transcriptional regulator